MDRLTSVIASILLGKTSELLSNIPDEKLRLICQAYAEQIVPDIAAQISQGKIQFSQIPLNLPPVVQQELDKIVLQTVFSILSNVSKQLPEGKARDILQNEVFLLINKSYISFVNDGDWQQAVIDEIKSYSCGYAKGISHEALDKLKDILPQNQYTAAICDEAHALAEDIINTVSAGGNLDTVYCIAESQAKSFLKAQAGGYAKTHISQSIDYAIGILADRVKRKGRGQYRSNYNKNVDYYAQNFRSILQNNSAYSIDRILNGESIDRVLADFAKDSTKQAATSFFVEQGQRTTQKFIKDSAKKLHTSGKGSRKTNRRIDAAADVVSDSLTGHLSSNIVDVISGDKDIATAVQDTAVETAKDSARQYMQKHGAELAEEAIKSITQSVAKRIKNETAKQLVVKTGSSLANANTITAVAGAVYDIGTSIKAYLNGEITKSELLRQIGEKGSAACLSSMAGTYGAGIGFALGGPVGAAIGGAIGSMAGYIASSMLYGSVLKAFEEEDKARMRAEQMHEFCETAIKHMQAARAEFIRQTELLFKNRELASQQAFKAIDEAIIECDFNKFSEGLNKINKSFGKSLQFTNFEEFNAFMESDESFEL